MWKLAWRNIWRNKPRTLIVVSAIAFTFALNLVSLGVSESNYTKMEKAAAEGAGGNLLIHGEGYWENQTNEAFIADPAPILQALEGVEGIRRVQRKVYINALLTSPTGSTGARVTGVVPDEDPELDKLSPFVVDGGAFVAAEPNGKIVLGIGVVDELGVKLGDRVVLTATAPNGEVVRALFHLGGVLDTQFEAIDDSSAYVHLADAQKAIGLGEGLTQLGVVIDEDSHRFETRDAVRKALGAHAAGLELLNWDEAVPELVGFIEVDRSFGYIFDVILFIIVAFGIANTLLMAVMERVRELGLLGALGLNPAKIATLVVFETILVALVALTSGFLLGYGIHVWFRDVGLDVAELYGDADFSGVTLTDPMMNSALNPSTWGIAASLVFLLVLFSALYPAWKASRMEPAQAMKTYE